MPQGFDRGVTSTPGDQHPSGATYPQQQSARYTRPQYSPYFGHSARDCAALHLCRLLRGARQSFMLTSAVAKRTQLFQSGLCSCCCCCCCCFCCCSCCICAGPRKAANSAEASEVSAASCATRCVCLSGGMKGAECSLLRCLGCSDRLYLLCCAVVCCPLSVPLLSPPQVNLVELEEPSEGGNSDLWSDDF